MEIDPGQLEQVVLNLVLNARDAMPAGGTIRIHSGNVELEEPEPFHHVTLMPGAYVLLTVRDSGEGMDDETLRRLFEPFFTTQGPRQGHGPRPLDVGRHRPPGRGRHSNP